MTESNILAGPALLHSTLCACVQQGLNHKRVLKPLGRRIQCWLQMEQLEELLKELQKLPQVANKDVAAGHMVMRHNTWQLMQQGNLTLLWLQSPLYSC